MGRSLIMSCNSKELSNIFHYYLVEESFELSSYCYKWNFQIRVRIKSDLITGNTSRGGTILTFLGKSLLFFSDRMVLNVV